VNNDRLVRSGSGYVGRTRRTSCSRTTRGSAASPAARARRAVYFIDWYDKAGVPLHAPELWDRTNGRLYRLRHGEQRDPSIVVRLACASALQRMPVEERWATAAALLAHDGDASDQNLPTVLWYGVEPLADLDLPRFVKLMHEAALAPVRSAMARRLGAGSDAQRNALCAALVAPGARTAELLAAFGAAVRANTGKDMPTGWPAVAVALLASTDAAIREPAAEIALAFGDANLAPLFRARLSDRRASSARRIEAIEGLVRLRDAATGPLLLDALAEPELRSAALAGLAAYELDAAPARILGVLGELDPTTREVALGTLCARPAYARAFLSSVLEGAASPRLLDAASLRRQLLAHGDASIEALLQKAWGRAVSKSAAAEQEIARYRALLTPAFLGQADKSRGRAIFARTCQACHSLFGQGGILGPDITGANRGDLEYLLGNIVDPSAEMGKEYQLVTLRLADGRLLAGNLVQDTPQTLTLRTVAGSQVVRRKDLAADKPDAPAIEYSKFSLMPPGQLQALSEPEARDLIAYLMSPRQVPLAASAENVGAFFNGRDLSGWEANPAVWSVVDGELVGRTTTGLPHNDWARSELLLGDFRLVVEVKLTPDEANSGIQFRSEARDDGEIAGYQADIGKGWWGLLYEEHGRAILQKAAASPAKPGEWNTYEILAVGDRVQLAINGVRTVDLVDPEGRKRGIVAPQVHSGGATEVRFRRFRLELDPQPLLSTVR
jgi:putative heme-binding domain-containing protein